jgi:urea transport system permease protein
VLVGAIGAAFAIGGLNTFIEYGSSASMAKVLVFVIVIAFLQIRPQGLVLRHAR